MAIDVFSQWWWKFGRELLTFTKPELILEGEKVIEKYNIPVARWANFGNILPTVNTRSVNIQSKGSVSTFGNPAGNAVGDAVGILFNTFASFNVFLLWPGFPGGIRSPHIHYNGEIYFLNNEQWKEYTTPVLKNLSDKLASAQSITFNDLASVSNAASYKQ
ncbi:MAG: hypothetical protein HKK67_13105 [Chlorobiaceae bacterium]|nr:hypothetical protein [Chlorobiaceae bacterium]